MSDFIVRLIRSRVVPAEAPAVYVSGGLDSAIVLHHLVEKIGDSNSIETYTAKFFNDKDECDKASEVAKYYGTRHTEVPIVDWVEGLKECMKFFPQPRYNIWPYWLAKAAIDSGRKNIYIGEGGDEIFGGYRDRGFRLGWAGQLLFIKYTYDVIHEHLRLNLHAPLSDLPWRRMMNYYDRPNKGIIRECYRGLLPDFVVDAPATPPAFTYYQAIWEREVKSHVPEKHRNLTEHNEIRQMLQYLAAKYWIEYNIEGK